MAGGQVSYEELVEAACDAAWKALKDSDQCYVNQADGMIDASGSGISLRPAVEAVIKTMDMHLAKVIEEASKQW